jgi:proteasome component ECM29
MVNLYADEILQFIQPLLNSPSWTIKQTAALTIADMCKSGGKEIEKHAAKLMPVMVSTLATRSWNGKENVLDAFGQLCVSSKSFFDDPTNQPSLGDVAKVSKVNRFQRFLRYPYHLSFHRADLCT